MINLNELRDRAYKCACDHGFHDKDYSDEHFLMLTITELSEAVEADRKGKRAYRDKFKLANAFQLDHMPEAFIDNFEMYIKDSIEDELADAVIRLLDFAGHLKIDINIEIPKYSKKYFDDIGSFTGVAYKACEWLTELIPSEYMINGALRFMLSWCEYLNIDIIWHIDQKQKYNELRPKMHGKKY